MSYQCWTDYTLSFCLFSEIALSIKTMFTLYRGWSLFHYVYCILMMFVMFQESIWDGVTSEEICVICHEELTVQPVKQLHCKHTFHSQVL